MKAQLFGKKVSRGSSTLEILIAFAVLSLMLTAMIEVAFSNQTIAVDTRTSSESLAIARRQIKSAQAAAKQDFNLVNATTSVVTKGSVTYDENLSVGQLGLFTKQATSTITWMLGGRLLSTVLSTLVTNPLAVSGGDTCSSILTGDWSHPKIINTSEVDFSPDAVTDIAVYKGLAYMTGYHTGTTPDLMIVDVSNPLTPVRTSTLDTGPGLNAVAVYASTTKVYAFAANRSTAGQLQVIDVTKPTAPFLATTTRVSGAGGVGNTVFYDPATNRLYLGLTANGSGPQFVIYDVSSTTSPIPKGTYRLGHDVNAITVKGNFAYVASPDPEELKILDVTNPNNPILAGGSGILPDQTANGESIWVVGSTAYLGRAVGLGGSTKQFYQFDVTNHALDPLPSAGTAIRAGESINGLVVRSSSVFVSTNASFQIRSLSSLGTIYGSLDISGFNGSPPGGLACENNLFYLAVLGSSGGSGHAALKIIGPS